MSTSATAVCPSSSSTASARGVDAPFISTDDRLAAMQAVSHLVSLGHRRIGLAVGPDRFVPVQRKVAGFRQALESALGIDDTDELIEHSFFSVEGGAAAATALMSRGSPASSRART